jgi:hypothetical protein
MHLEGEEVFGFAERPADCPLSEDEDSHHPKCVIFSCPWITILVVELDIVEDLCVQQLPFGSINLLPLVSWGGLKLKENICVDG